jgi:two-component system sensor histidine kinase CreC
MKLGIRIFFLYALIFTVCFYYPINWSLTNLRFRYLEGVEDLLVDQANIMAAIVGSNMEAGGFKPGELYKAFQGVYARQLNARIYQFDKESVDARIYITDNAGRIIFDSEDNSRIGEDYSVWRDVRLTLDGEYGARATLENPEDATSSVLYVAAPILVNGETAGVLTVGKPTTSINAFLQSAKPRIFRIGIIAATIAIILSFFVSYIVTLPIRRLTRYANDIRAGKRSPFPKLDRSEIGEMGEAFRKMQDALEGKKYVEQYVQKLTHEIKSPLSAIRGAAELMEEPMSDERRARFLTNIHNEVGRLQDIVDHLLELASLENLKALKKHETVSIGSIVKAILESFRPIISKKKLTVVNRITDDIMVIGDSFLLHRAISNLVHNAVDFSPTHGKISLSVKQEDTWVDLIVEDNGPGIPDYALDKVFDKFFSLQRPDTGRKSTGLGLNFVKEVAALHHGDVKLTNREGGGAQALLRLEARNQLEEPL